MRKQLMAYAKTKTQINGSNCTADQHFFFCFTDITFTLRLYKSEISRFRPFSVTAQPGLCQAWLLLPKTGSHIVAHLVIKFLSGPQAFKNFLAS